MFKKQPPQLEIQSYGGYFSEKAFLHKGLPPPHSSPEGPSETGTPEPGGIPPRPRSGRWTGPSGRRPGCRYQRSPSPSRPHGKREAPDIPAAPPFLFSWLPHSENTGGSGPHSPHCILFHPVSLRKSGWRPVS